MNIKKLEVNVSYPFFMKVYKDYENKNIDKKTFTDVIDFIESFVLRRFIVEAPTNAMNKIFMILYNKIDKNNYIVSLQEYMLKQKLSQRFPDDKEFSDKLKNKNFYDINKKKQMYIFERLENLNNKEIVNFIESPLTIEHIFPQKPSKEWKNNISKEDYKSLEDNLHTIQNLTLSANNGELGNKSFKEKKYMDKKDKEGVSGEQGYIFSKLWLNKYLQKIDEWNPKNMHERFKIIRDGFLKVWKYPNIKITYDSSTEINIFDAEDPTDKKLEYVIFLNEKKEITEISKLFTHLVSYLFKENENIFFSNDEIKKIIKITKNKDELRSKYPIDLNTIYYAENNFSSKDKFNIIKKLLTIFEMEDELIIKYSD